MAGGGPPLASHIPCNMEECKYHSRQVGRYAAPMLYLAQGKKKSMFRVKSMVVGLTRFHIPTYSDTLVALNRYQPIETTATQGRVSRCISMHDRHGSLPLPPSMHACNPVGYILGSNLTPESLRAAAAMVGGLIDYTCPLLTGTHLT